MSTHTSARMPGLLPRLTMTESAIWRPDVTVAAVVQRDGRFLFVEERVRGALVLNQPAGHLDPGESLVAAAIRETLEETRWEVEPLGLVGVYLWTSPLDGASFLRVVIAAKPVREHLDRQLDEGIERIVWLTPEALDAHPVPARSPLVRACLVDFISHGVVPLERLNLINSHGVKVV